MEIIDLLSVAYAEDYCVALNTVNNKYPTAKCSVIGQLTGITVIYYYTVSLYNDNEIKVIMFLYCTMQVSLSKCI